MTCYLNKYSQYKNDIFNKLNFDFKKGKKMIDIGCGDGTDVEIFINEFGLKTYGIDIYENKNLLKMNKLIFKKASILDIPYTDGFFDYVFLHDILHHIDEKNQRKEKHINALREIKRIVKRGGYIIILEGNRYNPLFYPHMVLMRKHNHFKQSYFEKIITDVFQNVEFRYFEAHVYPKNFLWFWKMYEKSMEKFCPKRFLAYNVAIIRN